MSNITDKLLALPAAEDLYYDDDGQDYYCNHRHTGLDVADLKSLAASYLALRDAAEEARTALDDWLHTYASDLCDEERVVEAYKNIKENHGTLVYIARVQSKLREALK